MTIDDYFSRPGGKPPFEEVFNTNYDCFKDITEYPDSDARMEAFTESLYNAIFTDEESWGKKGYDMMDALGTGNIEYFLAMACGWGAKSLAKKAMIIRDPEYKYHEKNEPATLAVYWDDGLVTNAACQVDVATFRVSEFTEAVFRHPYNNDVKMVKMGLRVTPIEKGNQYEFCCVTRDTLVNLKKQCLWWCDVNSNAVS